MEVRYAVLADSANISREGKVNISGIFDQVNAVRFPAGHPGSCLVLALEAHQSERGTHEVRIVFADADGNAIMETRLDVSVEENAPDASQPARGAHIVPMAFIPLPNPGHYTFDVFIDGRYASSVPLQAVQVSPQG